MTDRERPDRGQLILAGAVIIAIVILGLVAVFDAVFTAGSAGTGEPPEVETAPVAVDSELRQGARRVAIRVGHREPYGAPNLLFQEFDVAYRNYWIAVAEAASRGQNRAVDVSVDPSAPGTEYGTRIVQNESDVFDRPNPGCSGPGPGPACEDWYAVHPSSRASLGWFAMRLDATNLSDTETFVVRVENGSDRMEVQVESETDTLDVRVTVVGDTVPAPIDRTCEARSGQVVLDLYRGESASRDCQFPGLSALSGGVTVRFLNGTAATGVYELVVDETGLSYPGPTTVDDCVGGSSDPCTTPALWQVSVTTRITGERTDYVNSGNVSVYGVN